MADLASAASSQSCLVAVVRQAPFSSESLIEIEVMGGRSINIQRFKDIIRHPAASVFLRQDFSFFFSSWTLGRIFHWVVVGPPYFPPPLPSPLPLLPPFCSCCCCDPISSQQRPLSLLMSISCREDQLTLCNLGIIKYRFLRRQRADATGVHWLPGWPYHKYSAEALFDVHAATHTCERKG